MEKIAIIYNGADGSIKNEVKDVENILRENSFWPIVYPIYHPSELVKINAKAVFNLYESSMDDPWSETTVASVLEITNIPFTGSPSNALSICRNKSVAKELLKSVNLKVPSSIIRYPMIVKPSQQDASEGITQDSICMNDEELRDQIENTISKFKAPPIVEQFINEREFTVFVAFKKVVGVSEVVYNNKNTMPIYSFDAKWLEDSQEYKDTPVIFPTDYPKEITTAAVMASDFLGCRQYASVDFRGTTIIEVNANCDISPESDFMKCVKPRDYMIVKMVEEII